MTQSKPRRALIVIDVQREYVTGDLKIEYPDVQLSLRNIGRAMDAARAHQVPVIVVQQSAPASSPLFAKGSAGWELHEVITSRPHDHRLEKALPSAFAGTQLMTWLKEHQVDTISVVGYMTHNCVDSTVKEALHAGLAVECLSDATGSVRYENRAGSASARTIHETVHVVLQSRFAAVLSTDEWLRALAGELVPVRDTIFGSSRRTS